MGAIHLRRRTILAIAMIVLVGIGLGYYAWSLLNPPKPGAIRVGWPGPPKGGAGLFPVEIASRLLREVGVNLTTIAFLSYAEAYAALTRGDVDIIITNIDVVTNAINQNVSVKVILGHYDVAHWVVVVSSNISDVQQLRGKTIAFHARRSFDDSVLRQVFQQAGMQAGQDYFITYNPAIAARVSALVAGTVDGAVLSMESASKVIRENPGRFKIWLRPYENMPRMTVLVWVATEQTIRDHPEVVRFFVEYMVRAYRQAYSYGAEQLAALYVEFDPSIALEDAQAAFRLYLEGRFFSVNGGLSRELWDVGSQFILSQGFVQNVVSYDRAVYDSILNDVLAKLGRV